MSADETYVPIKALLIRVTRDAAMIGHAHPPPEITLRIFLWKAREQHLLNHTVDGGAVGDLFKPKEDEP